MGKDPAGQVPDYAFNTRGSADGIAICSKKSELESGPRLQPFMIDPMKQLVDTLHLLFAKFDLDQDAATLLNECRTLLSDPNFAGFPAYTMVKKWLSVEYIFTDKDAEDFSEQFKVLWPGVRYVVSPARLISLRQAIIRNDTQVPYNHVCLFMTFACAKLAIGTDDINAIVTESAEVAKTLVGDDLEFDPHISHSKIEAISNVIKAVATRVKDAHELISQEASAVQAMHGTKISTMSLDELYRKLASVSTVGDMRLILDQILSVRCHEISGSLRRAAEFLKSIVDLLEKYAAKIEEAR